MGKFKKGHTPWHIGKTSPFKGHKHSEESKEKIGAAGKGKRTKADNPMWKGGRKRHKGYVMIHRPEHPFAHRGGYVYEHRLVVEKQLGRYLTTSERIHHRNKDRVDNSPKNLMCFINHSAHMVFEMNGRISHKFITYDGRKFQ